MRIMVTGSRTWGACPQGVKHERPFDCPTYADAWHAMLLVIRAYLPKSMANADPVELLHGDAAGADRMAKKIWFTYGLGSIVGYPANWDELGKRAGHVRNGILVAHMPDLVLAFHLDNSPGTADAIAQARKAGLDVHIYPKEDL